MIRILNPVEGTNSFLRLKDARFYVAQGRAAAVGAHQIRLNLDHPANVALTARTGKDKRLSGVGYDKVKRDLTIAELRRLPLTGDPMRLLTLRTKRTQ